MTTSFLLSTIAWAAVLVAAAQCARVWLDVQDRNDRAQRHAQSMQMQRDYVAKATTMVENDERRTEMLTAMSAKLPTPPEPSPNAGRYTVDPCGDHWHVVTPSGVYMDGKHYRTEAAAQEVVDMLNSSPLIRGH